MKSVTTCTCNQANCTADAAYLYTWPGHDQAGVCATHRQAIQRIADALGLYIQFIELSPSVQGGEEAT